MGARFAFCAAKMAGITPCTPRNLSLIHIFIEDSTLELPLDSATAQSLKVATHEVLEGLTPREAKVLRMRFGIDMNTDHTLEEVGKQFDVDVYKRQY